MACTNLIDVLRSRRETGTAGITFIEGSEQEVFLSYTGLYEAALRGLSFLQSRGLNPGNELVFQVEDNQSFVVIFWACILGGIIPVPLSIGRNDEHRQKLFNVWEVLNEPYLVSSATQMDKLEVYVKEKGLERGYDMLKKRLVLEEALLAAEGAGNIYDVREDTIAFIQFSSGSTGSPKGVVLTHGNLVANMEGIGRGARYSVADRTLSWMPLTHDMGLIGFHLSPLFSNMNQYLMPTSLFIRTPALWMDKASEHKISILSSPNFGYKYFSKHCDAAVCYDWDLSEVRVIYNGAEPIAEQVCQEFLDQLEGYGLQRRAMCPVYGLAEASVAVSMSGMEDELIPVTVDRRKLNVGNTIGEEPGGNNGVSFVNVGRAIRHCALRITDNSNEVVDERVVGHVQIKGGNVTGGYYNNREETEKVLTADGWLRTGDLGFIKEGALYITGRAKDIIFLNGQNYYPHDIERVAETVAGIELNKIAVAGFFDEGRQKEETVGFIFYRGSLEEFVLLAKEVQAVVNRHVGIELDRLLPVKDIPRTTSGKLQRFKLLELYRSGVFEAEEKAIQALQQQLEEAGAKPANETEEKLLAIWKRVLNTSGIDVTTRFFEAGGNSLKAAELGMLLLKEFGVSPGLETLYTHATIRELAVKIGEAPKQTYLPIPVAANRVYYPATSAQKRLYYQWQADAGSIAYNIPVALVVNGVVDAVKLEACIQALVMRHDGLRMCFHPDGEPAFRIREEDVFSLHCIECTDAALDGRLKELVQPFRLDKGPLLRVALLVTATGKQVLFIDIHHIISDGMSLYHFIKELLLLYSGQALPDLPIQFKDYGCYENEVEMAWQGTAAESYWLEQLKGELPVLDLVTDYGRPVIFNTAGCKLGGILDEETTRRLRMLATANDCTLFVLMLTVYKVLLSKYTGQEELVTGIPVAGRLHPDTQYLLGMFVNNLAIRTRIEGELSFTELLGRVKAQLGEAQQYQGYPFERLAGQVGGKRDISRNAVFDTMFIYQNMGWPVVEDAGISFQRHFFDPGFSKFDVSLEIFEEKGSLAYGIEYCTGLFSKERMEGLMRHFEQLVQQVILYPDNKLSALSLLTDAEYTAYVNGFNNTGRLYEAEKTVLQLFEERVAQQPDAVAIEWEGSTMSYGKLNERAIALAGVLREKGMGPGVAGGILLRKSPELLIAILAVMKAGGCYLPIDTELPDERVQYIVKDSGCRVVITDSEQGMRVAEALTTDAAFFVVYTDKPLAAVGKQRSTEVVNKTTDLAYIIYTSGTTGQPKGVMVEHGSLMNYISWAAEVYCGNAAADFPLFTSISFDLTVTSLFTPLITGGRIVIYEDDGQMMALEKVLAENKVDIIKLTPSHLSILGSSKRLETTKGSMIKGIIAGGEQLETRLAQRVYDKLGGKAVIYNEYGPTEATVGCMIHRFEPGSELAMVPIGVPAANTRIYVLDKWLQPVSAGVVGELYIGGAGVARGYWLRKELTQERFIGDPFVKGQQLYKTGDRACRLASGVLVYIGRADQQVKISGYRIELAEIEHHLLEHPGIEEALVVVKTNEQEQKRLYGYYTGKEGLDAATLKQYLAGRLPYYMIPLNLVWLVAIPLTKNGKVDLQGLPDVTEIAGDKVIGLTANKTMELLVKVWEEVLDLKGIGVTDNFFELGGDSIKAVQVSSKLRQAGIVLAVKDILTYHTIEQISTHAHFTVDSSNGYEQGLAAGRLALFPIHQWFFGFDHGNRSYYNQSVLLRLERALNNELIEQAFAQLIKHHDGLRLNYDEGQGVLNFNNTLIDKDFIVEEVAAGESYSLAGLKKGFDITTGLLLKAVLVRTGDGSTLLFITAHHLVMDGVSWRILLEDLYSVYRSMEKGAEVKLPPKTAGLTDWSRQLATYGMGGKAGLEKTYWNGIVDPHFTIPQDMETEDWKAVNLQQVRGVVVGDKMDILLKKSYQSYKLDVQVVLLTALGMTLKEWTGRDTIMIELENHGRHLEGMDVSRTIGWFTVIHPLKLEIKARGIGDLLQAIKQECRNVPGQGIGYGLFKDGGAVGKPVRTPIRFNYLGQFGRELNNDLFSYDGSLHGQETDSCNEITAALEVNIMIMQGELLVTMDYNGKLHHERTITKLKDQFLHNLDLILAYLESGEGIHFVPADFDTVQLDEGDLTMLFE